MSQEATGQRFADPARFVENGSQLAASFAITRSLVKVEYVIDAVF
jgi:hypothetical protein